MTYPPYLRERARTMRVERRLTIDQIAERLALSRSTIFGWVRDIPVPRSQFEPGPAQAARLRGNRAMQAKYGRLREEAYAEGRASFDELSLEPTFRDFVCLYIAEGSKRDRNRVAISNSDPPVVKLSQRWLIRLSDKNPTYGVQYHADQELGRLCQAWGDLLGVDPRQIKAQRKSNSNSMTGRTWRSRLGVLTVTVDDTLLRARLQAWTDRLRQDWL